MSLKLALISEHASPLARPGGTDCGGQNIYVAQVARHAAARGWAVDIFTRRDDPFLPQVLQWCDGVRIIHVPAGPPTPVPKERLLPFMPAFTRYVCEFARAEDDKYDVVHANFWMSGLVAVGLKRRLGLPFVITFHALGKVRRQHLGHLDGFPSEREQLEAEIISCADRVIAECPQDELDLLTLYTADPARVELVPCGFDPLELWPVDPRVARASIGLAPHAQILLQLGRVVPRKGMDAGIRALRPLRDRYGPRPLMLIVGGESEAPDFDLTPELRRLSAVANTAGVTDQVVFMGRRDRAALKYLYSAADVFLSTPWYEPFGLTPLESMACGTPVIGSRVGGIQYTVREGQTGFLVPPDNPDAIAERLAQLYAQPELLRRLGENAVEHVQSRFTWSAVADQIETVYQQLVGVTA